mmetsp:Transcript_115147/g.247493  ORF Transcript_115147/g.247493 Transcript_115147/m.247493 type:complete len:391 (+) Transcript_115147:406-1578(+)
MPLAQAAGLPRGLRHVPGLPDPALRLPLRPDVGRARLHLVQHDRLRARGVRAHVPERHHSPRTPHKVLGDHGIPGCVRDDQHRGHEPGRPGHDRGAVLPVDRPLPACRGLRVPQVRRSPEGGGREGPLARPGEPPPLDQGLLVLAPPHGPLLPRELRLPLRHGMHHPGEPEHLQRRRRGDVRGLRDLEPSEEALVLCRPLRLGPGRRHGQPTRRLLLQPEHVQDEPGCPPRRRGAERGRHLADHFRHRHHQLARRDAGLRRRWLQLRDCGQVHRQAGPAPAQHRGLLDVDVHRLLRGHHGKPARRLGPLLDLPRAGAALSVPRGPPPLAAEMHSMGRTSPMYREVPKFVYTGFLAANVVAAGCELALRPIHQGGKHFHADLVSMQHKMKL